LRGDRMLLLSTLLRRFLLCWIARSVKMGRSARYHDQIFWTPDRFCEMIYVLDSTFRILNLYISMNVAAYPFPISSPCSKGLWTFSSSPDVSLHASPSQMTNAGPLGVNPHIPKSLVISPAKSGVVGTAPVQVVRSEPKFPESAPTIPPSP
jgi:hypothetical protein